MCTHNTGFCGEIRKLFCGYPSLIWRYEMKSGPKVIKLFSCSAQLSMKFFLLINLKLPTVANSFKLYIAEHENFSSNKYENANYCWHFHIH